MEAPDCLKKSVHFYRTTWRHIPQDNNLILDHVMGFMVDKVTLGQVFSEYFLFPSANSHSTTFINHPIVIAV
jgi:hypothetical protein